MPTTTTTYSFNKPVVGADEDDWGGYLNGNWDSVDDLLDGTTPVTGIDINSGTLDGVTIGGTTAGAGTFTTLTANTSITGTLATAAQPNITSVGSLTSLDVGGTVTADGLTVDGNVASITLNNTDTTIGQQRLGEINFDQNDPDGAGAGTVASMYALNRGSSSGFGALVFQTGTASSLADRMRIEYTGDISFYEDTGTTAKFFWDASAESLGIGTSSPSSTLAVETGSIASLSSYAGHIVVGPSSRTSSSGDYSGGILFDQANGVQASGKKGASITGFQDGSDVNSMGITFNVHGTDGSANRFEAMRITSAGNVGIGTSSPSRVAELYNTSNPALRINNGTDIADIGLASSAGALATGSTSGALVIARSGANDINLATNGTNRVTIDSSGNVGIGTSSPTALLHASSSTGATAIVEAGSGYNSRIRILSGNESFLEFGDAVDSDVGEIVYNHSSNYMRFNTNASEAMRIDSSGNLLVGKTSSSASTTGAELQAGSGGQSALIATAAGTKVGVINRTTSDGDLLEFRKDNVKVGSIGSVVGSYLSIGQGDTGILFQDDNDFIEPCNVSTSSGRDAAISLGTTFGRFKDLYLSGGVYLGGTGAANKLDDVETGIFTPTVFGATTAGTTVYGQQQGFYEKVGNVVNLMIGLSITSMSGTGSIKIGGLPFAAKNAAGYEANGSVMYTSFNIGSYTQLSPYIPLNTAVMDLFISTSNQTWTLAQVQGGWAMRITITYQV